MTGTENHRGARFALARVTIEALSPLTIGTGGGDDHDDAVCVKDANGLPVIPGSSLAGILRAALAGEEDSATHPRCCDLFGFQSKTTGAPSRVEVSWAQVHDAADRPVSFRGQALGDAVLTFVASGVRRDHVCINERGVADGRGKFDETLVPRGARFTFELRLEAGRMADVDELLGLLQSPTMRLGGRSRRGFGAFTIVRAEACVFDLANAGDRDRWRMLPASLHEAVPAGVLEPLEVRARQRTDRVGFSIALEAEDYWIFGGGEPVRPAHVRKSNVVDILPVSEPCVVWAGNRASVSAFLTLVPGSSVKGALRHRTAFHARRLRGECAPPVGQLAGVEDPPEVVELFGEVKPGKRRVESRAKAGRVFVSDVFLPGDATRDGALDHVALDRFTSGPIDGALFCEAPLFGGKLRIEVEIDRKPGHDGDVGISPQARHAFRAALRDLCEGRLGLGAGDARGHGFFRGEVEDGRGGMAWLEEIR